MMIADKRDDDAAKRGDIAGGRVSRIMAMMSFSNDVARAHAL